jgi:hypothetical protein
VSRSAEHPGVPGALGLAGGSKADRRHIKGAKLVSAVSSGIADRITEIYRLPRPAITIRNTPRYIVASQ